MDKVLQKIGEAVAAKLTLTVAEGTPTAVVHVGTSTLTFALTGTPLGANDYVVRIALGGGYGVATYQLSTNGGVNFGVVTIIPVDGKIIIGDGSKLEFSGIGVLVALDTYSWETVVVTYPFVNRWQTGFPDDTFIENCAIAEGRPYMSLYAGAIAYDRDWLMVKTATQKSITAVTHVGTSPLTFALTGTHRGNNDYVLQIVLGGAFGTATYRLSKDGGTTFETTTLVPVDGKIVIGDGTRLEFSGVGVLVANDTYSWVTESLIKETYQTHSYRGTVNVELLAFTEGELLGVVLDNHVGYHDQLIELFSEKRGIANDGVLVRLSIDAVPTLIKDGRVGKYRGTTVLNVEGMLYIDKLIPMAQLIEITPDEGD